MATDVGQIVGNLTEFYDFAGKTIITVGAGGGKLVDYARHAGRVIAIDRDEAALARLAAVVRERDLADKFEIVRADFLTVRSPGDVVFFEFCLHEMDEPKRALDHARTLARDVLVIDHAPGSPWTWYAAEDQGVAAGWAAVAQTQVRRQRDVEAFQHFRDYGEIEAFFARLGPKSRERIASLRDEPHITIPMPYRLALLGT